MGLYIFQHLAVGVVIRGLERPHGGTQRLGDIFVGGLVVISFAEHQPLLGGQEGDGLLQDQLQGVAVKSLVRGQPAGESFRVAAGLQGLPLFVQKSDDLVGGDAI